jgi:nitrous oxidase accessory protein NosD
MGVIIENNIINCPGGMPFYLKNIKGAIVRGNTIDGSSVGVIGVYTTASETFLDIVIADNYFNNSGNSMGQVLVASGRRLTFINNTFSKPLSSPYAVTFLGSGVTTISSYVSFIGNRFIKSASQTATVYYKNHIFSDVKTNRYSDNITDDDALANYFPY